MIVRSVRPSSGDSVPLGGPSFFPATTAASVGPISNFASIPTSMPLGVSSAGLSLPTMAASVGAIPNPASIPTSMPLGDSSAGPSNPILAASSAGEATSPSGLPAGTGAPVCPPAAVLVGSSSAESAMSVGTTSVAALPANSSASLITTTTTTAAALTSTRSADDRPHAPLTPFSDDDGQEEDGQESGQESGDDRSSNGDIARREATRREDQPAVSAPIMSSTVSRPPPGFGPSADPLLLSLQRLINSESVPSIESGSSSSTFAGLSSLTAARLTELLETVGAARNPASSAGTTTTTTSMPPPPPPPPSALTATSSSAIDASQMEMPPIDDATQMDTSPLPADPGNVDEDEEDDDVTMLYEENKEVVKTARRQVDEDTDDDEDFVFRPSTGTARMAATPTPSAPSSSTTSHGKKRKLNEPKFEVEDSHEDMFSKITSWMHVLDVPTYGADCLQNFRLGQNLFRKDVTRMCCLSFAQNGEKLFLVIKAPVLSSTRTYPPLYWIWLPQEEGLKEEITRDLSKLRDAPLNPNLKFIPVPNMSDTIFVCMLLRILRQYRSNRELSSLAVRCKKWNHAILYNEHTVEKSIKYAEKKNLL